MTLPDRPAVAMGDEPIVSSLFCVETSDPFDSYTYRLESIRFSGRTGYQSVVIAKTYNYGLALFLDGQIQSAEDDEALYHELLVQPAMLRHPSPYSEAARARPFARSWSMKAFVRPPWSILMASWLICAGNISTPFIWAPSTTLEAA